MRREISCWIVSESFDGQGSTAWDYLIRVEVRSLGLTSRASLLVPQHTLIPGTIQLAPPVGTIVIPAGECGSDAVVRAALDVTKVDVLTEGGRGGESVVPINGPGPDGRPVTSTTELTARLHSVPGLRGGEGTLRVQLQIVAQVATASAAQSPRSNLVHWT